MSPTNTCDGVTSPCNYPANGVGEQDVNIADALSRELTDNVLFDIHFDDAANFYVHGAPGSTSPPGPNDATVRQLEQDLGKLTLVNQQTGTIDQMTQHLADAEDQTILHMTTTDPLRTPSFTDFGNPTYFYQTGSPVCSAGSSPGCPQVNNGFAYNHGGDQPEVTATWVGYVGPTVRHLGQTNATWTDHTDTRPTMLSLLGVNSDYVMDGAPDTAVIDRSAVPSGLRRHLRAYQVLAAVYTQLNAAVGDFGHDSALISTTASESSSSDDSIYRGFNQQLTTCQGARDALANTIKNLIANAETGGATISEAEARALTFRAVGLIFDMRALSRISTPPTRQVCGG